ncbi:hypothetical protein PF008_g13488 [Phytophthora fragariae]|uniref:Uncharacterized protein n=1 Tax=Phytophthora fragariae TaxID=53985 RepID=A0A6G0RKM2_9STRA|nr:hypothetical protein PF008_g13488 [Phytophthora fragariae]
MVLTLSYIQQGVIFLAPLEVSWRQALVITFCTTGAYFGVLVAVSTVWTVTTTPRLSANARILKRVLVVETIVVFVYPAFNAVFRILHGAQQLAFVVVLFLLKVAMRFIMAYALRRGKGGVNDEERWRARLPEVVVFSTELFHVLYLTACLQGQHVTVGATIVLSLFDATGSVISIRRLLQRRKMVLVRKPLSQSRRESGGPAFHSLRDYVLVARPALSATQSLRNIVPGFKPTLSTSRSLKSIAPMPKETLSGVSSVIIPISGPTLPQLQRTTGQRLGPTLSSPHRLSPIDSNTSARFSSRRRSTITSVSNGRRLSIAISSVVNLKLARRSSSRASSHSDQSANRTNSRDSNAERKKIQPSYPILSLTTEEFATEVSRLETLSMTEYFLLIEYVKFIIPVMYGIFQFALARLPNAAYYPSLANATQQDVYRSQTNMAVFISLEIVSLTAFMAFLHRRLRFSVLHQLAFVLETAADDIQAKLAMFIPYCFFFFLEHNGVDYTFQFTWAHNA